MKQMGLYARVRRAVMMEGLSRREATTRFGIDPRSVRKMLSYSILYGVADTEEGSNG